jgi:hypothetical protein
MRIQTIIYSVIVLIMALSALIWLFPLDNQNPEPGSMPNQVNAK